MDDRIERLERSVEVTVELGLTAAVEARKAAMVADAVLTHLVAARQINRAQIMWTLRQAAEDAPPTLEAALSELLDQLGETLRLAALAVAAPGGSS